MDTSSYGKTTVMPPDRPISLRMIFILLLLLNLIVTQTIESEAFIKVTRFQVPSMVRVGDMVRLACIYELSGETLHAMKLFKDDKEFYRYTPAPTKEDQKMAFPVAGISVDVARSNERDIWLRNVNKRTAGIFKCQVSVENTFKSISAEKRMEVMERTRLPPESLVGGPSVGNRQQQQRHAVQQQQQPQYYGSGQITSMSVQGQQQSFATGPQTGNIIQLLYISSLISLLAQIFTHVF